MAKFDGMFRRATLADVAQIAELVDFAGGGPPLCLWTQMAGPGGDPWKIGRNRVSSETIGISYRNALIAEEAGKTIGALIGYPLGEPQPLEESEPALLVPLHELMNMAPRTWYVHALAAYPEHRGRGVGSALLAEADEFAAGAVLSSLSLIVTDTNTGARRLYERSGYCEAARRKMVKKDWRHPGIDWQHPGTDWVLLIKPAAKPARDS
jgi:ribosomal protein S18 acetylase RimI-like enzyme